MIKTYRQAKKYIKSFIPKIDKKSIKGSVYFNKFSRFIKSFNNPHNAFPSIHIAGTSGKGSTTYLISKILKSAGYKTGLHLSPHLISIRERAQINNTNISQYKFTKIVNKMKSIINKAKSTYFKTLSFIPIMQVLSFLYFKQEKIDIAVVETAVGGIYDGTNTINSNIAVITPIDFDHTSVLGKTLKEIAEKKAGIIKKHQIAVISAKQRQSVEQVLKTTSNRLKVNFYEDEKDFKVKIKKMTTRGVLFDYFEKDKKITNVFCSLVGSHQARNSALAIKTALELKKIGYKIKNSHIKKALSDSLYHGRFEIIKVGDKTIILDGAHNQHKFTALVDTLSKIYPKHKFICVFSCKKSKAMQKSVEILNKKMRSVIVTQFIQPTDNLQRMQRDPIETFIIVNKLKKIKFKGKIAEIPSLKKALILSLIEAEKNDKILITGSLHTVAEAKKLLLNKGFIKKIEALH